VLLDAHPSHGFVGGAALDKDGRLAGMIDMAPATLASLAPQTARISLVPTATIRKFLANVGLRPVEGNGTVADAKHAVVRVICVRK